MKWSRLLNKNSLTILSIYLKIAPMSSSNQFSIPLESEDKVISVTDFQIGLVLLMQADEFSNKNGMNHRKLHKRDKI